MHYVLVILCDSENDIDAMLKPFSEYEKVEPYKVYFSSDDIIDAVECCVRCNDLTKEGICDYFGALEVGWDEAGLYYKTTKNPQGWYDWYGIGGRWGGSLEGKNIILAGDLLKAEESFIPRSILTPDGKWLSHSSRETDKREIAPADWMKQVVKIYETYRDKMAVLVDYHN